MLATHWTMHHSGAGSPRYRARRPDSHGTIDDCQRGPKKPDVAGSLAHEILDFKERPAYLSQPDDNNPLFIFHRLDPSQRCCKSLRKYVCPFSIADSSASEHRRWIPHELRKSGHLTKRAARPLMVHRMNQVDT